MSGTKTRYVTSLLPSPLKTIFSLIAIQFVAETIIMFTLPLLHLHGGKIVEIFADSFLLTILCAPFVWILIRRRKQPEEELKASENSPRDILSGTKTGNASYLLPSALMTFLSLLAIQFVAETLIMFILPLLHLRDGELVENFADSILLTILCAPFVWFLISGRKRAEEELKASEDSLRVVFNSVNDAIFIYDLNGDILGVNDKMLEMYGVSHEEAFTLSNKDNCSSRNNPLGQLPRLWEKVMDGESQLFEWKARRPNDGFQFDVEVFLRRITLKGKDVILASVRDITKRKWAEEELRKLSLAVEQSPASIVITDTEGTIEYVNPKFTQVTGYTSEEAIGQNPRILKTEETAPAVHAELWRTITSGRVWQGEFYNKNKNGEFFWESAKIAPITDAAGAITHFMAIKEDITARKQMEQALQAERQRLFSLLENLPGFVCLHAPDYSIAFANRYFRECFGEVEGRLCYQIFQDREEPCKVCPTFQVFEDMELKVWEWGGSDNRTYQVYDYPFTDIDCSPLVLELGIDVTEQKSAERELRKNRAELITRNDELQNIYRQLEGKTRDLETAYAELKATQAQMLQNDKMASIGQLAAGVAHEINNPIGFVTSNLGTLEKYLAKLAGFIDAQAEKIASHAPPEVVEGLSEKRKVLKLDYILDDAKALIRESLDGTGRVQKIVQDLKTFSRVDAVEHTLVDINTCLESTINIVWNEIKYKATLQRDFGDLPQIKCYPQQLNQVFMNLLINAAHAIDKGGTITVRSWFEAGLIHVAISDTGCGIPGEIRTRIFEPFFTTKEVGKGTGLGLSISYDIVKKHDGEIRVASEVGKGTTFTVILPLEAG